MGTAGFSARELEGRIFDGEYDSPDEAGTRVQVHSTLEAIHCMKLEYTIGVTPGGTLKSLESTTVLFLKSWGCTPKIIFL